MSERLPQHCFLLYGYGSEYVLHPLFEYIVDHPELGEVIEIDALQEKEYLSKIELLKGKKSIIFITSAHFLEDQHLFNFLTSSQDSKIISPLEIMSFLRSQKNIFVAHDLTMPILTEEENYLMLFDYIVIPYPHQKSVAGNPVFISDVGWIKYAANLKSTTKEKGTIFFLSDFQMYRNYGFESMYKRFKFLFDHGIPIKLPVYIDTRIFEQKLRDRGVKVIPAIKDSVKEIIKHKHIIVNGMSSVITEAALLGKQVTVIQEEFYPPYLYQELFDRFPNLHKVRESHEIKLSATNPTGTNTVLVPFQPKKFISKILDLEKE